MAAKLSAILVLSLSNQDCLTPGVRNPNPTFSNTKVSSLQKYSVELAIYIRVINSLSVSNELFDFWLPQWLACQRWELVTIPRKKILVRSLYLLNLRCEITSKRPQFLIARVYLVVYLLYNFELPSGIYLLRKSILKTKYDRSKVPEHSESDPNAYLGELPRLAYYSLSCCFTCSQVELIMPFPFIFQYGGCGFSALL